MHPLPEIVGEFQPVREFVDEVCGLYFRSVILDEGQYITQHSHDHDHATYCGSGKARFWVDGQWSGDVEAGKAVAISAGRAHAFQALEPNTRLTCVHSVESAESIKKKGL